MIFRYYTIADARLQVKYGFSSVIVETLGSLPLPTKEKSPEKVEKSIAFC